jgi:hypothetical protein
MDEVITTLEGEPLTGAWSLLRGGGKSGCGMTGARSGVRGGFSGGGAAGMSRGLPQCGQLPFLPALDSATWRLCRQEGQMKVIMVRDLD